MKLCDRNFRDHLHFFPEDFFKGVFFGDSFFVCFIIERVAADWFFSCCFIACSYFFRASLSFRSLSFSVFLSLIFFCEEHEVKLTGAERISATIRKKGHRGFSKFHNLPDEIFFVTLRFKKKSE